ncbi:galactitol-1-phosphate 5-dehydrogenase [Neobacillus sp. MER 74]|uniref:galactitol-1-phosphate 5-dehydrogenase n=1 Tax=Neobacillus sp. MER 74 TaxID=2939566 RepID=UPI00203C7DC7|nr:galactitol-1-phosphate 5-dehydrogenase [Neobacillus sp. MER 74]MCM3118076.1 galactitol-1-phosphate 5-dehydrogenase [Neobacillus sp. MER 74]
MNMLMNAAVLHAPANLQYEQVEVPFVKRDEVLVRVRAAGVCGSDLGRVMKTGTYSFPTIPGHEFCGEVAEVGTDVVDFKIGDRVAVTPILPCGTCEFCETGDYGLCDNYNYLGSRTNGGYAEYIAAPSRNLIRLPEGLSFLEGAMIEPAAVTLHGMMRVAINVGETVAVLGCGTIGLMAIQFAKIMGATQVIAVDVAPDKLELAEQLGADICLNSRELDAALKIKKLTGGKGVNVAVETAGVVQTQEQCLRIAKKKGRVLYLGTAHKDVVLPPKSFECIVRNELTIVGSWNSYSAPFPGVEWQATIDYVKSGALKLQPLVTHTFHLSEAPQVFVDLVEHKFPFTKVIFEINTLIGE